MKKYQNDQHKQKIMENFQLSHAEIMLHEIYHYHVLVTSPRAKDYAYQAQSVWDQAKDPKRGTNYAYVNADSYALDAVAIYVQQYYKRSMSPIPFHELAKIDPEAAAELAIAPPVPDNATDIALDAPPPNFKGPPVTPGNPDLSLWEEITDNDSASPTPSSVVEINTTSAPADQRTGGLVNGGTCQTVNDCSSCPSGQCPTCAADYIITNQNPG